MNPILVPKQGEIACPKCHRIASITAFINNQNRCPATNCEQLVIIAGTTAFPARRLQPLSN